MKVVIFGSRDLLDPQDVEDAVWASGFLIDEVVSGCARGVDFNGQMFARKYGLPCTQMPASWRDRDGTYNMNAGKHRNEAMAKYAHAGIAVWDGVSTGTKDMIDRLTRHDKPCFVSKIQIGTVLYASEQFLVS